MLCMICIKWYLFKQNHTATSYYRSFSLFFFAADEMTLWQYQGAFNFDIFLKIIEQYFGALTTFLIEQTIKYNTFFYSKDSLGT